MKRAKDRRTKECPICKQITNRRVNVVNGVGECPHCHALLYAFHTGRRPNRRTLWVTSSGGCREVVEFVQEKIREAYEIPAFRFASFESELNFAKVLLDACGGEYDIAARVVECFYDDTTRRAYNIWQRYPQSLKQIVWRQGNFSTALALATKTAPSQQQPEALTLDLAAG